MFFTLESILLNVYLFQLSFGCYLFGIVVFHPFPPKLSMHFCFSSIFCQGNLDAFLLFNQFDNICLILTSRWFWWPVQPVHCSTIFDFYSSHSFRASLFSPLLMFKNIELLACVLIPESRPSCLRWAECFQLIDRGSCPLASWLCSEVPPSHPSLCSGCKHLLLSSLGAFKPRCRATRQLVRGADTGSNALLLLSCWISSVQLLKSVHRCVFAFGGIWGFSEYS